VPDVPHGAASIGWQFETKEQVSQRRWISFKWPRRVQQWPRSALVLASLLALMMAVFVGLGAMHIPAAWPGSKTLGDEWAALGTLYSFGGFLLAAFAALLATIAYINSTEKPRLFLHSSYALHFQDWSFALRLENRGPVAARFVAVRLRFVDASISLPYDGFPMGPWKTGPAGWEGSREAVWEGGADAVLHPRWPYIVPPFLCNLSVPTGQGVLKVEVVADDIPSFATEYPLMDK
jgi:hypothetical protein